MKKLITICAVVTMIFAVSGSVQADNSYQTVSWDQVALDTLVNGAVSYDKDNGNVVVGGTAFYNAIHAGGSYLGTQLVGGDGVNAEVAGNFAMYGVFTYTDAAGVLGNVMGNPSQLLGFEIVTNDLLIDLVGYDLNSEADWDIKDRYALDAHGVNEIDFLKASFAELQGWGYTELAPGVWFDLAVLGNVPSGQVALSVVIDNYSNAVWDSTLGSFNANLLPGVLGEGLAGVRRDSGIFVAEIPEPATMSLLGLGAFDPASQEA